jgi:hypothetical protein
MFYDPINSLPTKCAACGFPDLDHVPQPYYLVKSRTMSPNEMAPAENGNFFVRDRIRGVLELLAPSDCTYFPTCYKGTTDHTPWHLAVPSHHVVTANVNPAIPRCHTCGEPRSAHPGSQYSEWLWNYDSDHEAVKSSTWGSSEMGWDEWISRDLFMSVRLFSLLKQIKARGLDECTCSKATSPNADERKWIKAQLDLLKQRGVPLHAPGTIADSDAKWFRQYLKDQTTETAISPDWKSLEKIAKVKLPKSYKDFVSKAGPCSFHDVDEQEGFTVHVLPPSELDYESYRAGALVTNDDETDSVDGVVFATTDHGDCYCFDIRKDRKEFEVFLYLHECNCFEPYAPNFAACIKRFHAANG